jgi:type IV pilus assembly protein PilB
MGGETMKSEGARRDLLADTIKQIHLALKNNASYPGDHPAFSLAAEKSYQALMSLLDGEPAITVSVYGSKLLVDNIPIDRKTPATVKFAKELDERAIDSITFYRGLTLTDFRTFLDAMIKSPTIMNQEGGVASILREHDVSTIQLNEIKYGKIDNGAEQQDTNTMPGYLSGEDDTLGVSKAEFLHVLDDEPQRVPDLLQKAVDARAALDPLGNQDAQGKFVTESMYRIAREVLASQGGWHQFKEKMTSILSACDEDLITQIVRTMGVQEKGDANIVDGLVSEFLYRSLGHIAASDYQQYGTLDLTLIKSATACPEERKKIFSHLKEALGGLQDPDEEKTLYDLFFQEEERGNGNAPEQNHDPSSTAERKKDLKDDIARLVSEGKNKELKAIIRNLSDEFDDTSWKIRKNVAEHIQKITGTLDKFNKLKDNFRDISGVLIKMLTQETHVDVYLTIFDNLRQICNSHHCGSKYFINESIGGELLQSDKISMSQLQKALMARKKNRKSLQYNLGALNLVDEADLTHILAQSNHGYRVINLSEIKVIPEYVLRAVPVKFVRRHLVLPFKLEAGNLDIATGKPDDLNVLNDIRFLSGYSPMPYLAAEYYLLNAIEKFYKVKIITPDDHQIAEDLPVLEEEDELWEKEDANLQMDELKDSDAPVVKLVNTILKEAIVKKASDIHIEPYEHELRVRFRIDGTLTTLLTQSVRFTNALASRIKVMSGLDISERRLPQDGRFKVKIEGRYVDFRVSTFPGIFGEKVVLRLLDKSNLALDMHSLGMESQVLDTVLTSMSKSKGMILVTGPTGSGKTTTLYSMLQAMNEGSMNISTAEDPIEYNLEGINQFQIKPKIGLDFARALRAFLRQDPDIIMVGEVRDVETAEIAVKAALTGHLVLSTLHTNSAPETVTRLMDIGIEPYLITSSLNLIIAQRLMRKLCDHCKAETSPTDLQKKVLEKHGFALSSEQFYKAEGCEECNNTGYQGRVAIYEVMPMWKELQELILKGSSSIEIVGKAKELGLVTLQEQGFRMAAEGITDLDEWMRTVT